MKYVNMKQLKLFSWVALATVVATGCSLKKSDNALTSAQVAYNATDPNADIPGVGSTSSPTAEAVVGRLNTRMLGTVSPFSGNFKTVLTQVSTNLPQVTNPITAVGWDQTPLLTYAACTDVSQANTLSVFGVDITQSTTSQRSALINAGLKIADGYVGGQASSGPLAAQAGAIFGSLIDQDAAVTGETTKQVFVSVCMAANVFGIQMLGF
jgi:hypothetical protein